MNDIRKPTQIMVSISVPPPEVTSQREEICAVPVEDRVRDALELIDSGHPSHVEWIMVNKLYKDLTERKKRTPRMENLIKMIEPVLGKFGYHGKASEDF